MYSTSRRGVFFSRRCRTSSRSRARSSSLSSPRSIWPSTTILVEPRRLGLALGVITLLQNVGLWSSNRFAGWLADEAGAGPANPAGYATMLWFFGLLSLIALSSVVVLWRREVGPNGHGLELSRDALATKRQARSASEPG